MTLPLELGSIHDPAVRRAFEQLAMQFPITVTGGGGGGGAPSGPAGGDLGGTYPNPTVIKGQSGFTVGGVAVTLATDPALTNARTPTGSASGDLTGTYPGPTIAALAVTDAKVAAANKDGTAGTPSMRTLGTGAQQAAAGNDSRLSDARTPTAHQSTHQSGNSDALSGNLDATARHNVSKAGTLVGTRRGLNFIEGTGVTMTVADNAGSERVDVTVNSSGGGGSGTVVLDTWHTVGAGGEPAFNAPWAAAAGGVQPVQFRKYPDGRVQLRGLLQNTGGAFAYGTGTGKFFTLPVGYRPPQQENFDKQHFDADASMDLARIVVTTLGEVYIAGFITTGSAISGLTNSQQTIDGIEFDTDSVSTLVFGGSTFVAQAKWFTD